MNQKIISVPQLITLFMINRLVISMTFGSSSINNHNIWDCIISSLLIFFITFILIIPMIILFQNILSILSKKSLRLRGSA